MFEGVSDELNEYINTHDTRDNELLAEDPRVLRKNYSIVLEYVRELESKLRKDKKIIKDLNDKIVATETVKGDITQEKQQHVDKYIVKSLQTSIAGLKSVNARQRKKIEILQDKIIKSEEELVKLRKLKKK